MSDFIKHLAASAIGAAPEILPLALPGRGPLLQTDGKEKDLEIVEEFIDAPAAPAIHPAPVLEHLPSPSQPMESQDEEEGEEQKETPFERRSAPSAPTERLKQPLVHEAEAMRGSKRAPDRALLEEIVTLHSDSSANEAVPAKAGALSIAEQVRAAPGGAPVPVRNQTPEATRQNSEPEVSGANTPAAPINARPAESTIPETPRPLAATVPGTAAPLRPRTSPPRERVIRQRDPEPVRILIDRIEVRAVLPSPTSEPPKPEPKPAPRPSLDEYLQALAKKPS